MLGRDYQNIYHTEYLHNLSMAPPYIRKINDIQNKSMISQCVIATQFLSDKFGLRPKSDLYHAQCGMIVSNCNQVFNEVVQALNKLRAGNNSQIKSLMGSMSTSEFIK